MSKTNNNNTTKRSFSSPLAMGLGMGLLSLAPLASAHTMPSGVMKTPEPSSISFEPVASKLADLRERLPLGSGAEESTLSGPGSALVAAATCTATCNSDGSGSYSQENGCTYTQSCKGKA